MQPRAWANRALFPLTLLALILWTPPVAYMQQQRTIDGYAYVTDQSGAQQPVSALPVYLVHPARGRSYPRHTDASGYFLFENIPDDPAPYELEIYWGSTLMYRAPVPMGDLVNLGDIVIGSY